MSFPLLEAAMTFFDHPDNLIRTSVRTIILNIMTVFSADKDMGEEFTKALLTLPFVQFFGNLAM